MLKKEEKKEKKNSKCLKSELLFFPWASDPHLPPQSMVPPPSPVLSSSHPWLNIILSCLHPVHRQFPLAGLPANPPSPVYWNPLSWRQVAARPRPPPPHPAHPPPLCPLIHRAAFRMIVWNFASCNHLPLLKTPQCLFFALKLSPLTSVFNMLHISFLNSPPQLHSFLFSLFIFLQPPCLPFWQRAVA